MLTNFLHSDPKSWAKPKHSGAQGSDGGLKPPSDPGKYLPGSQEYRDPLAKASGDGPRQGMPVRQWIHDWGRTWELPSKDGGSCEL